MEKKLTEIIYDWAIEKFGNNFSFRDNQLETISQIVSTILNSNGKITHQIIQAPTGSGKSLINIISAGVLYEIYHISSYILCTDLYLYKQYADFIDRFNLTSFGYLKGQTGNYICPKSGEDVRCAECKIRKVSYTKLFQHDPNVNFCEFARKDQCDYIYERKCATEAGVTLLTYQNYYFQMNICSVKCNSHGILLPGAFDWREVIFGDECHNIPNIIQSRCRPVISKEDGQKMGKIFQFFKKAKTNSEFKKFWVQRKNKLMNLYENEESVYAKFMEFYNKMANKENDSYQNTISLLNYERKFVKPITYIGDILTNYLKSKLNKGFTLSGKDWEVFNLIAWLQNYHCYLDDFARAIEITGFHYTIKQIAKNDYITFSCVKEDGMIANFLLSHRDNFGELKYHHTIFTSATCGDFDTFTNNMGYSHLDQNFHNSPVFCDIPSNFDFSNSPIYIYDKLKMSFSKKKENFPEMARIISNILQKHKNENGIIQTGSYENAKAIYKLLSESDQKRILIYATSSEKESLISKISEKTNYILIGPSLNEGIDLPGKLCNFIIIMKIPFLSMSDKYVATKMKIFKKWYNNIAATNLIQGIGRGNRFKNDSSEIYILDSCFKRLFSYTKSQFPLYITNRFIKVDNEYEMYIRKENNQIPYAKVG